MDAKEHTFLNLVYKRSTIDNEFRLKLERLEKAYKLAVLRWERDADKKLNG